MTSRRRASDSRQLELPCSLTDAVTLRDTIAWLEETMEAQHAEIQALTTRLTRQDAQLSDERTQNRQLRATTHKLRSEVFLLQAQLRLTSPASAPLPDWLSGELRRLLAVAHPDKWSAGQEATALAHEVAATINHLRQRLGEGRV